MNQDWQSYSSYKTQKVIEREREKEKEKKKERERERKKERQKDRKRERERGREKKINLKNINLKKRNSTKLGHAEKVEKLRKGHFSQLVISAALPQPK